MSRPVVSIVGRPNVGKSTLFNALVGKKSAVVADFPGTTRDRHYGECLWNGKFLDIVDTGGVTGVYEEEMAWRPQLMSQVKQAIEESDLVLLCVDGRSQLTVEDDLAVELIRKSNVDCLLVVTKMDHPGLDMVLTDFYSLGLGEPFAVSVHTSRQTGDLLDKVVGLLEEKGAFLYEEEEDDQDIIKVAIVGRPNVGKSTLLNKILGYERVVVSPQAGTTVDSIDSYFVYKDQVFLLVDTAGIRRRGKIEKGVEKYSVLRAKRAILRADVVLVLVDSLEGVTNQDLHIVQMVVEAGKSLALILNKWDLALEKGQQESIDRQDLIKQYQRVLQEEIPFISYVPIQTISALEGLRVKKLLDLVVFLNGQRNLSLETKQLREIYDRALARHAPPSKNGQKLNIYRFFQSKSAPPEITFVVNDPQLVHFSYERYLINKLREIYPFEGTPVIIRWKKKGLEDVE